MDEVERLKTLIALLEGIEQSEKIVPWSAIPEALHDWLSEMLTNSKCPIDGIFRWDFDRLINRLEHKLNAAMVPSLSDQPEVVIAKWNVIKFGSRLRLTGYVEGTDKLTYRHSKIAPCASKQPLISTLQTQLSCSGDNDLLKLDAFQD